jgi:hypothetical protein
MEWLFDQGSIDWTKLSELYRIIPLEKKPDELKLAFANSCTNASSAKAGC